jgi:hypothetical protein
VSRGELEGLTFSATAAIEVNKIKLGLNTFLAFANLRVPADAILLHIKSSQSISPFTMSNLHSLQHRPVYSREQLRQYVKRSIKDTSYTLEELEADVKADPLEALAGLQMRQIGFNPWGNLALHYSPHKTLSLEHEELFKKIVIRGVGGYCMENNIFFATILRSLGYVLYISAARISNIVSANGRHPEGFIGW